MGGDLAYSYLGTQVTLLFGKQSADLILQAMHSAQSPGWRLGHGGERAHAADRREHGVRRAGKRPAADLGRARDAAAQLARGGARALLSFGFILAVGFLLLVSLTLTTALAALRGYALRHFEGMVGLFASMDFLLSIALGTGLVALIYRYLPARRLPWRQVLTGALVTALLFHLGRWAIGLYLGRATQPTAFGAAASFAALLLWLYYSAQIFVFGAEFTACLGQSRKPRAANAAATSS